MDLKVKTKKNFDFDDFLLSQAMKQKRIDRASGISLQLADGLKVIQLREGQENLTKELENKRKEIEDRMEILKAKWYRFKKKQRKFEEKITSNLEGIEQKKELRKKIAKRAKKEEDLHQKKQKEIEKLKRQLQESKKFCKKQVFDIEQHKPARKFLEATFKEAPSGHFESNMDPVEAVIKRYESQTQYNEQLLDDIAKNTDESLELQQEERRKKEKHQQEIALMYTKIADLTKKLESIQTENIMLEDKLEKKRQTDHAKNERLLMTVRAIENLSLVCEMQLPKLKKKKKPSNTSDLIPFKLLQIENFLLYKSAVIEHAKKLVKSEMDLIVNDDSSRYKTNTVSQLSTTMEYSRSPSMTL